jgi:hypothetical protein
LLTSPLLEHISHQVKIVSSVTVSALNSLGAGFGSLWIQNDSPKPGAEKGPHRFLINSKVLGFISALEKNPSVL